MQLPVETSTNTSRVIFISVVGIVFTIFFLRLIQLQWIYHKEYDQQSSENSIRRIISEPTRGLIYDRNGLLVCDNRPSYTATITPDQFNKNSFGVLATYLNSPEDFIRKQYRTAAKYNQFVPSRLKRDIDFPTLSALEEHRGDFPGVDFQMETKRYYVTKARASHLLGYIKEISDKQLEKQSTMYRQGDLIGATGLESAYEPFLRGLPGVELIAINAHGQFVGKFNDGKSDIPPKEGSDLLLAVDFKLQELAESLMADKRGAVVAIDPRDGGLLALVSKPDFDLLSMGGKTTQEQWNFLTESEEKPLFNRATMTRYPPGSTYKMLLAAAALEAEIIDINWRVQCRGAFTFGNHVFHDMHVHGSTNVIEAIQRSCNVFFYTLMLKNGLPRWTAMGDRFGFGKKTGIDIDEENAGLLPSEDYFNRIYGKRKWTQGYLVSLGIGQGEVGVSPIQMANYAAVLGNGGTLYQPHAVMGIRDRANGKIQKIPFNKKDVGVPKNVMDIIREGMFHVVMTPGGTAATARVKGINVAGKTGTAENPHGNDHAWFIGFAPYENPQIAICVMVENGGKGGAAAAPIAGKCFELFLRDYIKKITPAETEKKVALLR